MEKFLLHLNPLTGHEPAPTRRQLPPPLFELAFDERRCGQRFQGGFNRRHQFVRGVVPTREYLLLNVFRFHVLVGETAVFTVCQKAGCRRRNST